jgi:hypothetical protein
MSVVAMIEEEELPVESTSPMEPDPTTAAVPVPRASFTGPASQDDDASSEVWRLVA